MAFPPSPFIFQRCDLTQQSMVHIVQNPLRKGQKRSESGNENVCDVPASKEREPESLTRVCLSTNLLPSNSAGLAVILESEKSPLLPSDKSGKTNPFISQKC